MAGEADREFLLTYLLERFGIATDIFNEYLMFKKKNSFWFIKKSPLIKEISHLKIKRLGIKAFQELGRFFKPTTRIIQYFGHLATKAVFNINEEQLKTLLTGEYLPFNDDLENGYVILSLKGQTLGLGLLINGEVRSQLPTKDVKFLKV